MRGPGAPRHPPPGSVLGWWRYTVVALAWLVIIQSAAHGQPPLASEPAESWPARVPEHSTQGLAILEEYLAERIHLLEQRSPQFRDAMALGRAGSIPIVIGTRLQVRDRGVQRLPVGVPLGNNHIAELVVLMSEPSSPTISLIVIRVDLDRLRRMARWLMPLGRRRMQRWLDDATDAILIHEIWGHLAPILEAGDYTGSCPDPAPGQPATEACVMVRENDLRRELGLKPRRQYPLRLLGN